MDSISTFINEADTLTKAILYSVLTLLILSFAIYKMWEKVSFWWLRVMCHMPVVGKISRLAKNHSVADNNWFSAERDLCGEFLPYFQKSDVKPEFFNDCSRYLRKVQETGRNNLSMFGWIMLTVMVFIEAMGFSYVLAGWTIPGASEALKEQGAYGIAILISGLLVCLTHYTGHELHHNSLIKKIRTWYTQSGEQGYKMIPNNKVSLDNEHELIDENEPQWRQLLNRLTANDKVTPSHKITSLTVLFIIIIAIGSTYVRGQTMESLASEANINPVEDIYGSNTDFSGGDIYASNSVAEESLPTELLGSQNAVNEQAKIAKDHADHNGAWTTFIMLAFIFVFLQVLGILIGFKTGFAGKESSNAKSFIGKFRTASEFAAFHDRKRNQIAQHAQKSLEKLQAALVVDAQKTDIDGGVINRLKNTNGRNFYTYVQTVQDEQYKHQDAEANRAASSKAINVTLNTNIAVATTVISLSENEIEEWMTKLNWDRERTIALLEKHKAEEHKKQAVSEEDAMAMMTSAKSVEISDEDALRMLTETSGA